jgi:protein-tyrosine-phosphatase
MHIHFVCTGNVYRSRLAESYLKSNLIDSITASSSGTEAGKHYASNGPISWLAMRLIQRNNLTPFLKPTSETTTREMLAKADLIIFMNTPNYDYAKDHLGYCEKNYQIWRVLDFGEFPDSEAILTDERRQLEVSERTFEQIKQAVDNLVAELNVQARDQKFSMGFERESPD